MLLLSGNAQKIPPEKRIIFIPEFDKDAGNIKQDFAQLSTWQTEAL